MHALESDGLLEFTFFFVNLAKRIIQNNGKLLGRSALLFLETLHVLVIRVHFCHLFFTLCHGSSGSQQRLPDFEITLLIGRSLLRC